MSHKKANSSNRVAVAVDIGGTDLKTAVIDLKGNILHQKTISSESKQKKEKVLQQIVQAIEEEIIWVDQKKQSLIGIGIGVPGIVSSQRGIVYQSPHFPDWKNYPILKKLKSVFHFPIFIDNDANMAALGEGWRGVAKKLENFIFLTLGTGIGGAIVIRRKIFHGDSGFAGEAGHLVIDRDGFLCSCGGKGCLEKYASASGIFHMVSQVKGATEFSMKKLFELAKKGNVKEIKIFKMFGKALGVGITSIVNLLDIETIILGGGISQAFSIFYPSMIESISQHLYSTTFKKIRIKRAKLGNRAGIIGAARHLFLNQSL